MDEDVMSIDKDVIRMEAFYDQVACKFMAAYTYYIANLKMGETSYDGNVKFYGQVDSNRLNILSALSEAMTFFERKMQKDVDVIILSPNAAEKLRQSSGMAWEQETPQRKDRALSNGMGATLHGLMFSANVYSNPIIREDLIIVGNANIEDSKFMIYRRKPMDVLYEEANPSSELEKQLFDHALNKIEKAHFMKALIERYRQ